MIIILLFLGVILTMIITSLFYLLQSVCENAWCAPNSPNQTLTDSLYDGDDEATQNPATRIQTVLEDVCFDWSTDVDEYNRLINSENIVHNLHPEPLPPRIMRENAFIHYHPYFV